MKQRLLFPRQKVGLVWVGKPVRCSGQESCSNSRAISHSRDRTNELRVIDGLVTAHSAVGRYERAFDLLEQRLTLAKELQNLREELKSFEFYAQLYKQQGNYLTARNFYERAIILARTLEDSKQEVQLLDQLTKMLQRK